MLKYLQILQPSAFPASLLTPREGAGLGAQLGAAGLLDPGTEVNLGNAIRSRKNSEEGKNTGIDLNR